MEKGIEIRTGGLIIGNFKRDKERANFFYKPAYIAKGAVKIIDIPIVSKIMKYRGKISEKLFFDSGGRVYTAQALLFADKRFIPETLRDKYNISGLAHLLAMSGTHVGIIAAIFLSALFFLPLKLRMLLAVFGVWLIAVFGVFGITVIRAALFATVFMLAYIADMKVVSKKFLIFILSLFMIFSPLSITDISFLMSFGAVFGIVYLSDSGYGFFKTAIITGVAATLITAPLAMYVFGMTNHLSVLSTIILAPLIYLHILFTLIYLIFPSLGLPPLIIIETASNATAAFLADATYFGFILKTIPLWLLVLCAAYTAATLFSKYKWLSAAVLLVIFYPAPSRPDMIFPALAGSNKGFISFQNGKNEIFYQGSANAFKYSLLPLAAKYGVKTFDYGNIQVFNGENNYIRLKETGNDFNGICLNEKNKDCRFFYHTRSNSVTAKDVDGKTLHIIYKNKIKDKTIYEFSQTGNIIVKGGEIFANDKNNR